MEKVTTGDLKRVIALSDLPEEHLQWILDRSEYHEFEDGELVAKFGDPADVMWFSLEGKVSFYMNINGRQVYYFTFDNNKATGGVGGMMPYSRMKNYPGYSYASGKVRMLRLHKKYFHELELLNPDFIQKLIGYMTDRARAFATTELQHEKVNALGKLAAGIAHELNNPAAAINSIAGELKRKLDDNYTLTEKLLHCNLTPEQIQGIRMVVQGKEKDNSLLQKRTMLQRMESEDELDEWLGELAVPGSREIAETFSEYGFSKEELKTMTSQIDEKVFVDVVLWLENLLSSHMIIKDLTEASMRISNLVGAIKSHVHMDRSEDMEITDLHRDIDNTLTLLGYKIRGKNINVVKKFPENFPEIPAYVGELNQVWTNIIDNAIFAMEKNGELIIETGFDDDRATVSITDNGAGIPKEVMSRIFDPFFTTKKQGEGTGIGLDIVSRIVGHHHGEIKANSEPGKTTFTVQLPMHPHWNENK